MTVLYITNKYLIVIHNRIVIRYVLWYYERKNPRRKRSMKRIKKLSVMLLCCLLLSVIAMPVSASAAKLNKKSISLNVGKTYTLKASGTKEKITWTSSKKSVATVSSKGVVKAKKKGTAVITAKYGKKKLTCKVTVKQPVKSIKLNKTSATLKKGKSLTLKATISPSSANNKAVTWTSSNKKVATVSSKGVVKAVVNGTATITVKAKDGSGKKATCKITVGTSSNSTPVKTDPSIYFKTVELNATNVSQYFTYEIIDTYDTWGNHNGAKVYLKLKPSDWYLANSKDLAIEYNLSFDYIDNNGTKGTYNELCMTENCVLSRGSWGYTQYDRNSVTLKFTRAKGTLIFVDKKAVKDIQFSYKKDIKRKKAIICKYIKEVEEYIFKNELYNLYADEHSFILQSFE